LGSHSGYIVDVSVRAAAEVHNDIFSLTFGWLTGFLVDLLTFGLNKLATSWTCPLEPPQRYTSTFFLIDFWLTYWLFGWLAEFWAKQFGYIVDVSARTAAEVHNDICWLTFGWLTGFLVDLLTFGLNRLTTSWTCLPEPPQRYTSTFSIDFWLTYWLFGWLDDFCAN